MTISLDKTTCPNCGNTLTFNPETQSLGCDLCSQVSDIQEKDMENIRHYIAPFQLSQKQVEVLFYEWLVNANLEIPADIIENTSIDLIYGQYYPAWVFNILNKKNNLTFDVLRYAGGSEYADGRIRYVLENTAFDFQYVRPYEEKYTMGFDVIAWDISKETAWQNYIQNQRENAANYRLKNDIMFCYVPIWIVRYTYQNNEYIFYTDGIKGQMAKGTAPTDPFIIERNIVLKKYKSSAKIAAISFFSWLFVLIVLQEQDFAFLVATIFFFVFLVYILKFFYYAFIVAFVKTKGKIEQIRKKVEYALTLYLAEKK